MTENPTTSCSRCGTVISAEAAGGLCPRCLMALNFDSRTMPEGEEPPHAPILTPEELAEKFPQYEILECLGRGGMGVVYKARQKSLDRIVAIKLLPPERVGEARFSERFAVEAATLARLSHPNIVTVHDFGETGGLFYIVMEYVDGVNLRDLLREGKLEAKQALAIVPPICDALQYAHDKGIVHRDIKPENLLLDKDGRVKIADFGIAKLIEPVAAVCDRRTSPGDDQQRSQTAATVLAGTPDYAAPEQSNGTADHRADIYALGVVLYEMLTGERPDRDAVAPSRRVEIDVRLDEIVLRALARKPELRYQTAGEFRTVVQTVATSPPAAPAEESTRRKKRRKKVIFRFLDPLPDKNELLRTALTMLIAGVVIIALMDGAWDKAREWIDQASDPKHSVEERLSMIGLVVACIAIITALVWKLPRWLIGGSENPAAARSTQRRPIIAALVLTVILLAAYKQLWPSRAYPPSSTSSAYQAPVIGRIKFECRHVESVEGGDKGSSFDVKAWGDTQWKPSSGQTISLEGGRTIFFKTRVDARRFTPPMAMVTASLNGKDWETRRIQLRAEPPAQNLDFTNGLRVTVHWSPIEVPDLHAKSPDPIQQDAMLRGSELADQEHPLTTSTAPQSFGPVTERVVHEMESGLGNEALRLESGELFSLPKSMTDKWLAESSANLLVGKAGMDFQLILHKGILRDMNHVDWDHATPEAFRRAMEKGPGMMKPGKSENLWAAYDWTGVEMPATFGFLLASRAQGMLQVLGDTPDGYGLRIRYKLLPGPNGETILPPDFEHVRDQATETARRYYPDLNVTMDGDRFIMQRNLREYEIHNPSKSGEVSAETHKETGPAADGFLLVLEPITKEPATQAIQLASQADGPQLLDRPYWKGFVDHRFDPRNNSGVSMFFDFGAAVNPQFKNEMMALLEMKPALDAPEKQTLETINAVNNTNRFLDLELAVIDAKANGLGDQHPTMVAASDVLARFREGNPDIPDAIWRQLVGHRLEKAKADLAALNKNGLAGRHPEVIKQNFRIQALADLLEAPEKSVSIPVPAPADGSNVITLSTQGDITVAGAACPPDQLDTRLKELAAKHFETVIIRSDPGAPMARVAALTEACKEAGIEKIALRAD